jgi:hypothetical protein
MSEVEQKKLSREEIRRRIELVSGASTRIKASPLAPETRIDGNGRDRDHVPEAPRPLMREPTPAEPFPLTALGERLGSAATAIQDRVQAPLAICAQAVLATATFAVQAHADVLLPIGKGRAKPLSAYFITIAESGERKTECDYQAGWAMRERERKLREKRDDEMQAYLNDKLAWDRARDEP